MNGCRCDDFLTGFRFAVFSRWQYVEVWHFPKPVMFSLCVMLLKACQIGRVVGITPSPSSTIQIQCSPELDISENRKILYIREEDEGQRPEH